MSYADIPAETDAERILYALDRQADHIQKLTEAINSLGQNQQWIIDRAEGIFQMFSSPQFMNTLMTGGLLNGGPAAFGGAEPESAEPESASTGA